jgi:flagellar motor switch/type III secretory pathway protein FliN
MQATVEPTNEAQSADTATVLPDHTDAFGWLPCRLTLQIPVTGFSVGDLLRLNVGSIITTPCHYTHDVPLRVNGLLIGWTEFEVIADRLAVRITELA